MKFAFIMDPPEYIKPYKDSSLALMQAARDLGHEVYYLVQPDLYIADRKAWGRAAALTDIGADHFKLSELAAMPLGGFDVIFMRKDPPVDKAFIQTTFILAQAELDGARVYNSPEALQKYNEKIYATLFPEITPKTLISAHKQTIRDFVATLDRAVLKPTDMMGGHGVFVSDIGDFNLDVIIELLTEGGKAQIVVQQFLPQIAQGDRRIILVNGQIAEHALVRYPKEGSMRGNMAAGGTTGVEPVNDRDREIAAIVGPRLVKDGVYFVGLDIIGGHLIEINHTSPTGLREIEKVSGEKLAKKVIENAINR